MTTVREFAERVLMARTLEEKLAPAPKGLVDESRGRAELKLTRPGRPDELSWGSDTQRVEFPRAHELKTEAARGRLLHFFANHELLATELMALALLKFPDAPAAFRQGLLHTLQEEQEHTRWYMQQMEMYGLTFGQLPVNGFFWSQVSTMQSPLDYVTRLPLTFEQANLDFSLYYRRLFHEFGDESTSALFQRIHDDEISHVSYGLHWMRRWKDPAHDDFTAYAERLIFPLSPVRAKGKEPLDYDGRRRAGLTDEFIRRLELFSRSKGRTPNVYLFNPYAEVEVQDGAALPPGEGLAGDLDLLPLALAHREDIVLVRQKPSEAHQHYLRQCGLDLPEIEQLDANGHLRADSLTRTRKLNALRPWAWTPRAHARLASIMPQTGAAQEARWHEAQANLFSKVTSVALQKAIGDPLAGEVVSSLTEAQTVWKKWSAPGQTPLVVKRPFGLAGRRHELITQWHRPTERMLASALEICGQLIMEPWLPRVVDFSVQAERTRQGLRFLALTRLHTTERGRFLACSASSRVRLLFPSELKRFLTRDGRQPQWIREYYEEVVFRALEPMLQRAEFYGPFGLDALVFTSAEGQLELRPVVELNPRLTMGRVAWELAQRYADHHGVCRFQIETIKTARAEGFDSLTALYDTVRAERPSLTWYGEKCRIAKGRIALTEPDDKARSFATAIFS